MDMVTYMVHDLRTGDVLHVHVEPEDHRSTRGEVLRLAGLAERDGLGVAIAPDAVPATGPVRFRDGKWEKADDGAGFGTAGAGPGPQLPAVERVYEKIRRPDREG